METLRYDYKPKTYVMVLAGLLFAGFGVLLGKEASENDRGLILNGIIRFDTVDATIFYWVLAAVCGLAVLAALFGLVRALGAPGEVMLDAHAITAPKGMFGNTVDIVRYDRITDLQLQEFRSQKLLTIHHRDGRLTINRSMLPAMSDFDEIADAIGARCVALRRR